MNNKNNFLYCNKRKDEVAQRCFLLLNIITNCLAPFPSIWHCFYHVQLMVKKHTYNIRLHKEKQWQGWKPKNG